MDLLSVESFNSTFGPKKTRKKPKFQSTDFGELMKNVDTNEGTYK